MSLFSLLLHQVCFQVSYGFRFGSKVCLVWCTAGSLVSCIPSGNLGYNYRVNDTNDTPSDSATDDKDEEDDVEDEETDSDTESDSDVETDGNESAADSECDVSSENKECEQCMRVNCCEAFLENPCLFGDCPCKDACKEGDPADLDACLIECELGGDTNCIIEHCSEECNQQQSVIR